MIYTEGASDQFWKWLFDRAKRDYYPRRSLCEWLEQSIEEWYKLPIHTCGYRAIKKRLVTSTTGLFVETKVMCAHCGELLRVEDNKPQLRETLKSLKEDVKRYEEALRQ